MALPLTRRNFFLSLLASAVAAKVPLGIDAVTAPVPTQEEVWYGDFVKLYNFTCDVAEIGIVDGVRLWAPTRIDPETFLA